MSYGVYPEVSLKEARAKRDASRKLLADGFDPGQAKKRGLLEREAAFANSFEVVAWKWYERNLPTWKTVTANKRLSLLEKDLIPWLKEKPISEIDALELLKVLRRIEERGANDTARVARQLLDQIFRYARLNQLCSHNPTMDLQGALAPKTTFHRPAITEPQAFGKLLVAIDQYQGSIIVRSLLALCPLLFQRPGEMIAMEWSEIDLEEAVWSLPENKMKMGFAHIVPLPEQAVAILKELKPLTGRRKYVFPGQRDPRNKHVSAATINKALQNLGIDTKTAHCAHGFRATARTMLDEQLGYRVEWIEHQLAHQVRDALGRAYNRTTHLPQRQEMMQEWANYLDQLKIRTAKNKLDTKGLITNE
ncbi:tyrosine-type recombinase/integrase [Pseudomaricurvus hydrocarbonicus]